MLIYATPTDLADWVTPEPANATALLRSASLLVRKTTRNALYATDSDGYPSDAQVRGAFRDATCAQVARWTALGIDPTAGASAPTAAPVASKSIGSASVTYDTSASASVTALQARQVEAETLCQAAVTILAEHDLVSARPGTV